MRNLFFIAALMNVAPASAENTMSAGNLLIACTTAAEHWVEFCNGFFQAAHDAGANAGRVCAPAGTTRIDLVATYERFAPLVIEQHSGSEDESGFRLAVDILAVVYPCRE